MGKSLTRKNRAAAQGKFSYGVERPPLMALSGLKKKSEIQLNHDKIGKVHSRAIPSSWKKRRVFSKGPQISPPGSLGYPVTICVLYSCILSRIIPIATRRLLPASLSRVAGRATAEVSGLARLTSCSSDFFLFPFREMFPCYYSMNSCINHNHVITISS
jgi:hypothetical protein